MKENEIDEENQARIEKQTNSYTKLLNLKKANR